jgi:neopullulanase
MRKIIFLTLCLSATYGFCQKKQPDFLHVEPQNWWVGMKIPALQIMFHKAGISGKTVSVVYPGVTLKSVQKVENADFLFINLEISTVALPGKIPVVFEEGKEKFTYFYELRSKSAVANRNQGFSPADVIYLIMPDRFANGNTKNDTLPGFFQGTHRNEPFGRHGGDLKGISDHLDYIKNLGVTALWLNPVLENNQKTESYHGYAITDLYKIDSRFGSNQDYVNFVEKCHQNGLKVIQDMVANHIGDQHWIMKNPPEKSWIHYYPDFKPTSYRTGVPSDPYASRTDLQKMVDGWFVAWMPDLNQQNEWLANYLIQNSLWWIEYAGIDGIRMDTYPYPDKNFMNRWAKTLLTEYPKFNIVGEAWINSVPMTAYWQKGVRNSDGYASELPSVTDFPFCFTVAQALNEEGGWDTGLSRLHFLLGQDFNYAKPQDNLTFLDNHDMTRFFLSVNRNLEKYKMGLAFLLTTRGTPQLYYGTELLMDGDGASHPNVRRDFPGGWTGDTINAFLPAGRTPQQNEAFDYLKKLLDWRKTATAIHTGKLTHYVPEDNIYVYFRYNKQQTVMVVMNGNKEVKTLNTSRLIENMKGFTQAKNILSGEKISDLKTLSLPPQTALILELF